MCVYSVKGKGWRYDFTLRGTRYTESWFKTKSEARQAEAKRKEEVGNPRPGETQETPTDTIFLEFVNRRLDFVKAYKSASYYQTYASMARGWIRRWGEMRCGNITQEMVEEHVRGRKEVSPSLLSKLSFRSRGVLGGYGLGPDGV
jgi:hypothetical protein